MLKVFALIVTHLGALGIGFAAGVYFLPILIAPPAPDAAQVEQAAESRLFVGEFSRDRIDSDGLHWGEGQISIGADVISFVGELAPGPDYKLYLSPEYVETEADFERLKPTMVRVGDVRTFENFLINVPAGIDPASYSSVIVWCESFGEFITSAQYQELAGI